MTRLSELNKSINALNDLWPLLDGEDKYKIIDLRNRLNEQASELAHKTLIDGAPELTDAISKLEQTTQAAKDAKDSIDNVVERISKVEKTILKAGKAAVKVARLIYIL